MVGVDALDFGRDGVVETLDDPPVGVAGLVQDFPHPDAPRVLELFDHAAHVGQVFPPVAVRVPLGALAAAVAVAGAVVVSARTAPVAQREQQLVAVAVGHLQQAGRAVLAAGEGPRANQHSLRQGGHQTVDFAVREKLVGMAAVGELARVERGGAVRLAVEHQARAFAVEEARAVGTGGPQGVRSGDEDGEKQEQDKGARGSHKLEKVEAWRIADRDCAARMVSRT